MHYCSSNSPNITPETLAVINNRTIEQSDFLNQTQSIAQVPGVDLVSQDGKINILKDMVNEELVFQDALKNGFQFKNLDIKHTIVREYLKNQFGDKIPVVSDEKVRQFYNDNQNNIDQVRVSHILISTQETTKDKKPKHTDQEAHAIADKVHSEIVSGKISFLDAIKKYSEDPSKSSNNGDLNFFPRAKMVAPFSNASFDLKKIGDISPVIKTDFGYHIIQLTGEQRGFDLYKEKIRWKLYQDMMKPQIDEYFNKLRESAKLKLFTDRLATKVDK